MAVNPIVDRIRARGHWNIAIRPEPFQPDRVSLDQLEGTISNAVVRLRGWPVPYIDPRERRRRGATWIGQDIEAQNVPHREAWRLFTTGQFTHLRVISADASERVDSGPPLPEPASPIEVWEILFYLTEIVELAARLALTDAGGETMTIDATLNCGIGRQLIAGMPNRELDGDYQTSISAIRDKRNIARGHLVAESRQVAVEMSKSILWAFGFHALESVLTEYQQELTSNR